MYKLFWKTYKAKIVNVDRSLYNVQFFRGFTWEVVEMAAEWAKEKSEREKQTFALDELTRIY